MLDYDPTNNLPTQSQRHLHRRQVRRGFTGELYCLLRQLLSREEVHNLKLKKLRQPKKRAHGIQFPFPFPICVCFAISVLISLITTTFDFSQYPGWRILQPTSTCKPCPSLPWWFLAMKFRGHVKTSPDISVLLLRWASQASRLPEAEAWSLLCAVYISELIHWIWADPAWSWGCLHRQVYTDACFKNLGKQS